MRYILLITLISTPAYAINIGYGGYLEDKTNAAQPYSGTVPMTFSLFKEATGGTPLVTEEQKSVIVVDGYFSVALGLRPPPLGGGDEIYLEVVIDGETLSPRQKLTATPYAINLIAPLSCPIDKIAKSTGSGWACADDAVGNAQSLTCADGQIGRAQGGGWVCGNDDAGITAVTAAAPLSILPSTKGSARLGLKSCAQTGQVLMWDGSAWQCAKPGVSANPGSGLEVGGGTIVQLQSCADNQILRYDTTFGWDCYTPPTQKNVVGSDAITIAGNDNSYTVQLKSCADGELLVRDGASWACRPFQATKANALESHPNSARDVEGYWVSGPGCDAAAELGKVIARETIGQSEDGTWAQRTHLCFCSNFQAGHWSPGGSWVLDGSMDYRWRCVR